MNLWIPTLCTGVVTIIFLIAERVFPGRELPNSKGWYFRVLLVNAFQVGITFATNKLWFKWLSGSSVFKLAARRENAGAMRTTARPSVASTGATSSKFDDE